MAASGVLGVRAHVLRDVCRNAANLLPVPPTTFIAERVADAPQWDGGTPAEVHTPTN